MIKIISADDYHFYLFGVLNSFLHMISAKIFREQLMTAILEQKQKLVTDLEKSLKIPSSKEELDLDVLTEGLRMLRGEIGVLEGIKSMTTERPCKAERGAIVITSINIYFISVKSEQLRVDGKYCIGISVDSDLSLAMKGKVKGENFIFRGIMHTIRDIF